MKERESFWLRFRKSPPHTQANIVCTALIMVATFAYAIIAGCQLIVMHGTLGQMQRSGDQATQQMWSAIGNINWIARSMDWSQKTTQNGLEASEKQSRDAIKATQEQMRLDERAWVGAGSPSITLNTASPIKIETRVAILGKSPAVDIRSRLGMRPFGPDHTLTLDDIVLDRKEVSTGTAVPGTNFPVKEVGETPVSAAEAGTIQVVLGRKAILYFYGQITYRDIFKVHHWTHFCYAITSADVNDAYPCKIYNDTDADSETLKKRDSMQTSPRHL
jgi:hypothetical protein